MSWSVSGLHLEKQRNFVYDVELEGKALKISLEVTGYDHGNAKEALAGAKWKRQRMYLIEEEFAEERKECLIEARLERVVLMAHLLPVDVYF